MYLILLYATIGIYSGRTHQSPVIDGILCDSCWYETDVVSATFVNYKPRVDLPMSQTTDIRTCYDSEFLYFGFHMSDLDPTRIPSPMSARDTDVPADKITIYLDTFHDEVNCYVFSVSIAGVQSESRLTAISGNDRTWDAVWHSAAALTDSGWSVEAAIPFSCLRYSSSNEQEWGVNFRRDITLSNESGYLFRMKEQGGVDVALFGDLENLASLPDAIHIEFKPFISGRLQVDGEEGNKRQITGDFGVDIKIPLNAHSIIDVTFNPDFGQVESDADQYNISHWAPWLAERRPFFVEGAEIFEMPFNMYYSRSIGSIASNNEVIPILGGVKVTGSAGETRFGLLEVITDDVRDDTSLVEPLASYAIGSVLQEFSPGNWMKISATSADYPEQDSRDYFFARSAAFTGGLEPIDNFKLKGELGYTWNEDVNFQGNHAVRLIGGYYPESFEFSLSYQNKGASFNPMSLGYNQAVGEASWEIYTGYYKSFERDYLQNAWLIFNPFLRRDSQNRNADSGADAFLGVMTVERFFLELSFGYNDRWFDRYEGPEGRWYPAGFSGGVSVSTDWRNPIASWLNASYRSYLDSYTRNLGLGVCVRPIPELSIDIQPSLNFQGEATKYNWEEDVWEGNETDWRSLKLSANLMLNRDMRVRLTGQYSSFGNSWESSSDRSTTSSMWCNILYSWEFFPGSWVHFLAGEEAEIGDDPTLTVYGKLVHSF